MRTDSARAGLLSACLVLLPLLFWRSAVENFETPKVSYLLATALLLLALALANRAVARDAFRPREVWRRLDPVSLSVFAVLASALFSTVGSKLWRSSLLGVEPTHAGLLTTAALVVVFFAVRSLLPDARGLRVVLAAPVVASAFLGLYACLQAVRLDPVPWSNTSDLAGWFRPFATLGHPSHLGDYLAMTLPLTLAFVLRGARQGRLWSAAALGLLMLAEIAALALSLARGGWIGAGLALSVFLALTFGESPRPMRRALMALGGLGATAVALTLATASGRQLFGGVLERALRFRESPRGYLWSAALEVFKENPVFGSGLETFQFAFLKHRPVGYWHVEWGRTPATAHSEPLQILATQGAVGAMAALALVASLLWAGRRALRRTRGDERALVAAVVAGVVGFLAQATVGFSVVATSSLFAALAGILSGYALPGEARAEASPFGTPRQGVLLFGGGVFATVSVLLQGPRSDGSVDLAGRVPVLAAMGVLLVATLLGAWSVLRLVSGEDDDPAPPPEDRPRASLELRGRWARRARAAGVALGVGLASHPLILRPLRVSHAAREGLQWMQADPSRAVTAFERAHALDPRNDWVSARLGLALEAQALRAKGADDARPWLLRARGAFERALEANPLQPHHHGNLGRVLALLSPLGGATVEEAFAEMDRGLALDPNNGELLYDAANTALLLGELPRAGGYATTALALYPEFAPSRAQLGYVALRDGRLDEAVSLLRTALGARWPSHQVDRAAAEGNLAAALLQTGHPDEALPHARKAVEGAPGAPQLRFDLSRALERSAAQGAARGPEPGAR